MAIEIYISLSTKRVIRIHERVILERGKQRIIRTDNGPEFTSKELKLFTKDNGIQILLIKP